MSFTNEEVWNPIFGYENIYAVSSFGRVKRLDRKYVSSRSGRLVSQSERILKPVGSDYLHVTLSKNGTHKDKAIHRLVAEAFIPNPNNLPQVNHKDCNKHNNKVENLEWVSAKENTYHAYQNKLNPIDKIDLVAANVETGQVLCFESAKAFEEATFSKDALGHLYRGTACNGYKLSFKDEQKQALQESKIAKINHPGYNKSIKLKCLETNQIFNSIRQCGKYFDCDDELIRVAVRYKNGFVKKLNLTFQEV